MDIRTVALSRNRNSQVIRLPKEFEFQGADAVEIVKIGEEITIRPVKQKKPSWDSLYDEMCAHPEFEPDRTSIGESARFLQCMESKE